MTETQNTESAMLVPAGEKIKLSDVKQGDVLALYLRSGDVLQKWPAGRCTKTRIDLKGQQYTRRGYVVGAQSTGWVGRYEWIEVWDAEKHEAEISRKQVQIKLNKSRATLAAFKWTEVSQQQADAVFAAMDAAGMLEVPDK